MQVWGCKGGSWIAAVYYLIGQSIINGERYVRDKYSYPGITMIDGLGLASTYDSSYAYT
jgi:hypothetical protein